MAKKGGIRTLLKSQHAKGSKNCLNLNATIFVIFFDHSERESARNILS